MRMMRAVPGLAAMVAFFLPCVEGSGPLAGVQFSGYELAGYAGVLRQLESVNGPLLLATQLAIVLTAIAATWLVILGWTGAWTPLRVACGAYIAAAAAVLVATGLAQGALPPGALLMAPASLGYVAIESAGAINRRSRRGPRANLGVPGRDVPVAA
jgi:hypothetical protein